MDIYAAFRDMVDSLLEMHLETYLQMYLVV